MFVFGAVIHSSGPTHVVLRLFKSYQGVKKMMFYDHSCFAASEHTASVETAQVPLVVRKFVIILFEVRFHPSSKLNE